MTRREARHDVAAEAPEDLSYVIAANLKAAQAERDGMTVEEFAALVGLSARLVQKHRAGGSPPSYPNLVRYSRALDKPVSWFFERHEIEAAA